MEYRLLGKTGFKVSFLGLGGLPIQRVPVDEAVAIVEMALEKGINFIDSARAYRDSEEKIGRGIRGKRDRVILASKSGVTSSERMKLEIEKSLAAFATEYVDLYQCHNISTSEKLDKVLSPGGALEALKDAKKEGKIRAVGISSHRIAVAVEAVKSGFFDTVQVPFNFIEREAEKELLTLAKSLDVGLIVMKPLAGGALRRPDLALRFLLDKEVSTIIPGMDRLEQVEENYRLVMEGKLLDKDELACLLEEAEEKGDRFCRRCEYCKPCPQGIDISYHFILHGYYHRYGMKDYAREIYAKLPVKADACKQCGLCETRCPYSLPIREMLPAVYKDLG